MTDSSSRPSLLLVDGSAYLHRAYHVHTSLTDRRGRPTGAIYGVVNILNRQLRRLGPDYVAVVMDAPGKNFRHDMYPDYKAHRKPMEDDLKRQIEPLYQIIEALGLPLLAVSGVEADDVIGTLACEGEAEGMEVMILSGDKDMAQLVTDHVILHDIDRPAMGADGVEQKFSVRPERIIDYLSLCGDPVDNIPGVPGVGKKTAAAWLQKYDSLDGVIEHAGEISGKVGESLRNNLDCLLLYRNLVTIRTDVEIDRSVRQLQRGKENRKQLKTLYAEYELRSLLRELEAGGSEDSQEDPEDGHPPAADEKNYTAVLTLKDLDQWISKARRAGAFALDTETTSIDPQQAALVGISLATEPGQAAYIPVGHTVLGAPKQLDAKKVLTRLQPLLVDPKLTKIGHHLKYDVAVLRRHGAEFDGPFHDTMLESYVHNSTVSRHNLDDLSRVYLNQETIRFGAVAGTGKKQVTFDQVPLDAATPYAAEDADMTLRLHRYFWPRLEQNPALQNIYQEMELPLSEVLTDMERVGVALDVDTLQTLSQELHAQRREVKQAITEECGREINPLSPLDLEQVLYEERGLSTVRKTPKGKRSTAEDVLEELAEEDVLPRMILDYRQHTKLLSTYIDKLPKMINPETGRLHTSFHQAVTATGRLSSSDPNLQNIPIRTEQGRKIRQAFVPRAGQTLIAADYSQIELRIMAHISGAPALREAFAKGADVHRATAAEVFGVKIKDVDPDQRRAAKAINFGLMYGMSAFGLAKQLKIDRAEADAYIKTYFARYPEVQAYMEQTREQARSQRYVETVSGRRLYLEEIHSKNHNQRRYAERTAINAPMQGTAADIIKRAMINVHQWLRQKHPNSAILLQVHDELVLEAPLAEVEEITAGLREKMEGCAKLDVPMVVDVHHGENWDQAH